MENKASQGIKKERIYLLMGKQRLLNLGQITNGNVMAFTTDFTTSGWERTKSAEGELHKWYDLVEIKNNSYKFRSDEFVEKGQHDGMHILFAGCSVTWGDALNIEETWGWRVYDSISKKHKTSGFFNIGFPGTSIAQEIFWIMKYCKKFGNPDAIFFLMPNLGRFFSIQLADNSDRDPALGSSIIYTEDEAETPGSLLLASHLTFECYYMLEQFCKANDIKLISSSWSFGKEDNNAIGKTTSLFDGHFESFFNMIGNNVNPMQWIYDYMQENPDATIKARDDSHPGSAEQAYYASRMIDRYNEITNEDIRL